ncbi:MAG: hypothetical protein IJH22_01745 [Firmicutes bacterium]|nr:hypothetical protein [Bacillota bacterium]
MQAVSILIHQRRGSSAVFLAVILASLMTITLTLVFAGRNQARISIADGSLNLAAVSLLSEYDYYVQRDYGLFLLQGTDPQLSRSLRDYTGFNAKASAGRFSTVSTDPVRKQILDYMKSTGGAGLIRDAVTGDSADGGSGSPGGSGGSGSTGSGSADRTLRHGPTITSLPSRSWPDADIITEARGLGEKLTNPEAIFRTGTNKFLMDEYILQKFNRAEHVNAADHFFSSEVEYIICGQLSDEKNKHRVDLALEAVRTGLNLSHIYSDPKKVEAIVAAAEVLTPGPIGALTQVAIAASWAAAESVNDVKLLHKGHKVPIFKTDASWAIDLDSILEGYSGEDGCIHPRVDTGRTYGDYLRILLFVKDDNILTARILDLIQINMRKNYDEKFLVQECATGVSVDADIYGRKLSYDRIY